MSLNRMDEEKIEQNNIDSKMKEAVSNELTSYMNPGNSTLPLNNKQNSLSSEIAGSLGVLGLNKDEPIPTPQIVKPIIKTYRSDAEEIIKSGHISSINIAIAESNKILKRSQEQGGVDPEIKKIRINKNILIVSILLIVGGSLAIGIPYFILNSKYTPQIPIEQDYSKPIITPDITEKINIDDLNLDRVNTTLKERVDQSSIRPGQIKNIYLIEKVAGIEEIITSTRFLNLIKAVVPSEIERTIKTQYMFGMHNFNSNQRFLILKTGSYDVTYAGMLSWETDLWQDFKEVFDLKFGDITATTTQGFGIEIKQFQDAIYNNKDCRIIKDSTGKIIFLYSIVDPNTVVLTTSVDTLKELINRINKATTVVQ